MGNMWGNETNKDKIGHMDKKSLIMKPVMFYAILINYLLVLVPPPFVFEAVSHVVQVGPLNCCVAEGDLELTPTVSTSSGLALQVSASLTFLVFDSNLKDQ